ncbi:MAG: hypothetical protein KF806_15610 [Nitrospira sp.]|nr:hypothetical protein [Nitrospira sp.]
MISPDEQRILSAKPPGPMSKRESWATTIVFRLFRTAARHDRGTIGDWGYLCGMSQGDARPRTPAAVTRNSLPGEEADA